jgi:hypothetical protein
MDVKGLQFSAHLLKLVVVANPLQHLTKRKIGQPKSLPGQFAFQPFRFRVGCARKVVDPYRGINNHHL